MRRLVVKAAHAVMIKDAEFAFLFRREIGSLVKLSHLKGLTELQDLNLDGTKITDAGVAELKKALPKCSVFR